VLCTPEKETSHTRQSPSRVMDIPDTVKASAVRYTVLSSGEQAVKKDIDRVTDDVWEN